LLILALVALATLFVAFREFSWRHNWSMIQRGCQLKVVSGVSCLDIIIGPSTFVNHWAIVRFHISPDRIDEFAAKNECELSDRTSFTRFRRGVASELQTLPSIGRHFYRAGTTTSGQSFELLVDSSGLVIVSMTLDD
jgi:hypothetical protein